MGGFRQEAHTCNTGQPEKALLASQKGFFGFFAFNPIGVLQREKGYLLREWSHLLRYPFPVMVTQFILRTDKKDSAGCARCPRTTQADDQAV